MRPPRERPRVAQEETAQSCRKGPARAKFEAMPTYGNASRGLVLAIPSEVTTPAYMSKSSRPSPISRRTLQGQQKIDGLPRITEFTLHKVPRYTAGSVSFGASRLRSARDDPYSAAKNGRSSKAGGHGGPPLPGASPPAPVSASRKTSAIAQQHNLEFRDSANTRCYNRYRNSSHR